MTHYILQFKSSTTFYPRSVMHMLPYPDILLYITREFYKRPGERNLNLKGRPLETVYRKLDSRLPVSRTGNGRSTRHIREYVDNLYE